MSPLRRLATRAVAHVIRRFPRVCDVNRESPEAEGLRIAATDIQLCPWLPSAPHKCSKPVGFSL